MSLIWCGNLGLLLSSFSLAIFGNISSYNYWLDLLQSWWSKWIWLLVSKFVSILNPWVPSKKSQHPKINLHGSNTKQDGMINNLWNENNFPITNASKTPAQKLKWQSCGIANYFMGASNNFTVTCLGAQASSKLKMVRLNMFTSLMDI